MATTLATARGNVYTTLAAALTTCNPYKRRQTNYQYPCFVVGWPQEYDARPDMGTGRDFVLDVLIAVEVGEDDSADDLLSSLLDSAVTAIQTNNAWDVQPISDFGEQQTADDRTVIWCRLPVSVLA
jgi:hypothetical protein